MSQSHRSTSSSFKPIYTEKIGKARGEHKVNSDLHSNLIHIECEARKVREDIEKGQHEQRLKELKDLLPIIGAEDWKYHTVDNLLGLTSS